MSQAKIQLTVGSVSFSGEGEQEWLSQMMHDVLEAAPNLAKMETTIASGEPDVEASIVDGVDQRFTQPLAIYIKEKANDSSQQIRFLVTADWLRRRGSTELKTGAVTAALRDNQQKRLTNPADCLNKNVAQGLCEKNGTGFFITPDGKKVLGTGNNGPCRGLFRSSEQASRRVA